MLLIVSNGGKTSTASTSGGNIFKDVEGEEGNDCFGFLRDP